MKIELQGIPLFDESFESTEDLVDRYRDEELENGRDVPRFAWESLLLVVGGWLLKKAADELWKLAYEYKKRKKASEEKVADRNAADQRHRELMEKLDTVVSANTPKAPQDIEWFQALLSRGDIVLVVEFSNTAESDFRAGFERTLTTAGNALVFEQTDGKKTGDSPT